MDYISLLESVLTYSLKCWYRNLWVRGKTKLTIINTASKIVQGPQRQLVKLCTMQTKRNVSNSSEPNNDHL